MPGRNTASFKFGGTTFGRAQQAGTLSPRLPQFNCRNSTNAYAFQFKNYTQRTQFDARNAGTCCGEPIRPFDAKRQFDGRAVPPKAKDCQKATAAGKCTTLDFKKPADTVGCGKATPSTIIKNIQIRCPVQCHDAGSLYSGAGVKHGRYGVFTRQGPASETNLILQYKFNPEYEQDVYNGCQNSRMFVEWLCNVPIVLRFYAVLNYPQGCGCDCCNVNGGYTGPSLAVTAGDLTATWENSLNTGMITVDSACSGGTLNGTFMANYGGNQSVSMPYFQYLSNGTTRYIEGSGSFGSSSVPACCGGTVRYSGTDGCGGSTYTDKTLAAKWSAGPAIATTSGMLEHQTTNTISGYDACTGSSTAALNFTPWTGLAETFQSTQTGTGTLTKSTGLLTFSGTQSYSGCCGSGSFTASFNNGCGGSTTRDYAVRRKYNLAASQQIGWVVQCYSGGPGQYYVGKYALDCSGVASAGEYVTGPFGTWNDCAARIDASGDTDVQTVCTTTVGPPCPSCCHYSNNGQTGQSLIAVLLCTSGNQCCNHGKYVAYPTKGWAISGATCCAPSSGFGW